MFRALLCPLLATLLLTPTALSAQAPAKNPSRKVSLQVTFMAVRTSDLDALGINFDFVPIPAPPASPKQFFATATGDSIAQNYRRLTQTVGIQSHIFTLATVIVPNGMPATFVVHAQFTDSALETISNQEKSFPRLTSSSQIDGKTTFIPHIGVADLVSLEMDSPLGDGRIVRLGAVSSGQQIVINTAPVKAQEASSTPGIAPQIQSRERNVVSDAKDLLIFITPTILVGTPGRAVVSAPEKAITFNMTNGDLQAAIMRMERQYGIRCSVQDGVDVHRTMSVGITDSPLSQVLQILASTVNAQVVQNPDGVYAFTPKPAIVPKGPAYPALPNPFVGGFGSAHLFAEPFPYSVKFLHVHPPLIILPDLLNGRDMGNAQTKERERVYALD